ncbi:non-ribosomal peptide synthetase [Paracoccus aminophilus]|uniref:non-ribosomal peptide synthetase n=1 Tax=Paracoccus aminophilus TaxID=34003 RepID=UPI00041880F6|nr:amino acid adenylation domain-containing protein [Paracoccus aminophilus]
MTPTSHGQAALYHLHLLEPDGSAYNTAFALEIAEAIDLSAMQKAADSLLARHSALRAGYALRGGKIVQVIRDAARCPVVVDRLGPMSDAALSHRLSALLAQPFEVTRGSPVRLHLIELEPDHWVLMFGVHHVAIDARSLMVALDQLLQDYRWQVRGGPEPRLPASDYGDYVAWEARQLAEKRDLWASQWAGSAEVALPPPQFHADETELSQRPDLTGLGVAQHRIAAEECAEIEAFCRQISISPAALFLGAFGLVIGARAEEAGLNVAVLTDAVMAAGGALPLHLVGYAVNPVLVAIMPKEIGASAWLQDVHLRLNQSLTRQAYPFSLLVQQLPAGARSASLPIVGAAFNFLRVPGRAPLAGLLDGSDEGWTSLYDMSLRSVFVPQQQSQFEFSMDCIRHSGGLDLSLRCPPERYGQATIEEVLDGVISTVRQLLDSAQPLLALDHRGRTERGPIAGPALAETALLAVGSPQSAHPLNLFDRIDAHLAHQSPTIAVADAQGEMSRAELLARSQEIAAELTRRGVQGIVGILVRRSRMILPAVLGVLRAGLAYVPIDPAYPEDRIRYMLKDSQASAIIYDESTQDHALLNDFSGLRLKVSDRFARGDVKLARPAPDDLAYLIYTSGSTGRPKGTMISHGAVSAFLWWCIQEFDESAFDTAIFSTSLCFDLSIFEMFYPLSVGKRIRVVESAIELRAILRHQELGRLLVNTVPSVVRELLSAEVDFAPVSVLNMAGEPIPQWVVEALAQQSADRRAAGAQEIEVRNLYGPSEDTTYSTCMRFGPGLWSNRLIGRAIAGTELHLLDAQLRPVPRGACGEICLTGQGLAQGYWQRPDLTEEKFVPCPFLPGQRMYRTGDIGRARLDGLIEFHGRRDAQVKLRGYRIELGEIETALLRQPSVREAAVSVFEFGETQVLAAHVVADPFDEHALRAALAERLPHFMVPERFVALEALPLTPNGKIDRKELRLERRVLHAGTEDLSLAETRLMAVWAGVLGRAAIDVEQGFFEAGGNSLALISLQAALEKELGITVQIAELYEVPTIRHQARKFFPDPSPSQSPPEPEASDPEPALPDRHLRQAHFMDQRKKRQARR